MKIKYLIMNYHNFNELQVLDFLNCINNDLPIPVSEKVDLNEFVYKMKTKGLISCAFDGKKIVGACFYYCNNYDSRIAFLSLLAVKKRYRRHGIAKNIVDMMIQYCKEHNFCKIQLYTRNTNLQAINFYVSKNFYEISSDRIGDLKLELNLGGD